MFEAAHSERSAVEAERVWALWADPGRWPQWNEQLERVELDGELRAGATARVKLRRGGTVRLEVLDHDPGRGLVTRIRFPGARLEHEHRLAARDDRVEITHRLRVAGPLAGFWASMLGRKRLRESVTEFVARERELAEPQPKPARAGAKRRRGRR